MHCDFEVGDGFIIHGEKEDFKNNDRVQNLKCFLASLFLLVHAIISFLKTAAAGASRIDKSSKKTIVIPSCSPLYLQDIGTYVIAENLSAKKGIYDYGCWDLL